MKTLLITTISVIALTGCTGMSFSSFQDKVENKAHAKTTEKVTKKLGVPSMKKEKTTTEKVADVATGKTTVEDVAADAAADKVTDMTVGKIL